MLRQFFNQVEELMSPERINMCYQDKISDLNTPEARLWYLNKMKEMALSKLIGTFRSAGLPVDADLANNPTKIAAFIQLIRDRNSVTSNKYTTLALDRLARNRLEPSKPSEVSQEEAIAEEANDAAFELTFRASRFNYCLNEVSKLLKMHLSMEEKIKQEVADAPESIHRLTMRS